MKIIITESQVKRLFINEVRDDEILNRILDKISDEGIESLTKAERQYLDNESKGVEDRDLDNLLNDGDVEFDGNLDGVDIKFVWDTTEEWDEDPMEYVHRGGFFYDDTEYYASIYADENYEFMSFDLHDGEDYVVLEDEVEDKLTEFFYDVNSKISQTL